MLTPSPRSSAKRLIRALKGEAFASPPMWLMRQAGRYLPEYRAIRAGARDFLDLCYTPEKATEVTLQPIRRYGFDAAILFADILLIPDALGQHLRFVEGEGPRLDPVAGPQDLPRLSLDRLHTHLAPVYETVERVRAALPDETALIGFAGAPWTVATYMVEGQGSDDQRAARLWSYRDPDSFQLLIDLLVEATAQYLLAQIRAGAEAVQIFDSWAAMMPDEPFADWVLEPTRRLVERLRAEAPGVPVIGFPRGARNLTGYLEATGVTAIGLDTAVPAAFARERLQPQAAVQGNLDPLALLAGGAALERHTRHLLETLGAGPYVFNLGHGILPQTPLEHVSRLVEIVRGGAPA